MIDGENEDDDDDGDDDDDNDDNDDDDDECHPQYSLVHQTKHTSVGCLISLIGD